jgi:hypothetical protein
MSRIIWREADRYKPTTVHGEMDETFWHITGTIVPAQPGFSIITGDFMEDDDPAGPFIYIREPVIAFHIDLFERPRPITPTGIIRDCLECFGDTCGRLLLPPWLTEPEKLEKIERFKAHFEKAMTLRAEDRAKKAAKAAAAE